ncbi:MAG: dipicolinate synthase subunit B [Oscillospiraceae bacterium]|nr:dipicolinate synthase subunit B [Oscillospiraceae bacterium]
MEDKTIGFAICGSFCTHSRAIAALEAVTAQYKHVIPIVSEIVSVTDTRFGTAKDLLERMTNLCGQPPMATVKETEPIGPKGLLDLLVIAPCTGNTLSKMAAGITDSSVTMAAKAQLRNGRPVVVCVASNDGLSGSAPAIGQLMMRKNLYFVPFGQDDPKNKPTSLVADFTQLPATMEHALQGKQVQPVLLRA